MIVYNQLEKIIGIMQRKFFVASCVRIKSMYIFGIIRTEVRNAKVKMERKGKKREKSMKRERKMDE